MARRRVNEYRRVWKQHNGEIPKGWHIYHLDGNSSNNNIDNLICVTPTMHYQIHYALWDRYGNPRDAFAVNKLAANADGWVPTVGDPNGWKKYNEKIKSGVIKHPSLGTEWTKERRERTMKNRKNNNPITFRGVSYYSVREAERETGISRYLIRKEMSDQ